MAKKLNIEKGQQPPVTIINEPYPAGQNVSLQQALAAAERAVNDAKQK